MSTAFEHASQQEFYDYLVQCSNAYYNTGVAIISDDEFDRLQHLYETRFATPFSYLGKANRRKIRLPLPMPSLNKAKDQHALDLYLKSLKSLGITSASTFLVTAKIDGVSCLYVKKGRVESLMTRGDGAIGSDISSLLEYLPFRSFATPDDCMIRGELVLYHQDYKTHFDPTEPPRNIVSGLVNSKTLQPKELGLLRFIGYFVQGLTPQQAFRSLQQWNIPTPTLLEVNSKQLQANQLEQTLQQFKHQTSYDMDGLVIYPASLLEPPKIDNPKGTIAFKVQSQGASAKVIQVEWSPSRYGTLCPRVQLEPIQLQGVTIQYATAFNAKYVRDHSIGPGAVLSIIRSGDVIPYITAVLTPASQPQFPSVPFEWVDDVHIALKSAQDHTELQVKQLTHFVDTLHLKGLKEATIRKLVESGILTIDQLLFLTYPDLLRMDALTGVKGTCTKTCEKIAQALTTARQDITLKLLLLGSSCFPAFGDKKMEVALQAVPVTQWLTAPSISNEQQQHAIDALHRVGIKTIAKEFVDCLLRFKQQYQETKVLSLVLQSSTPPPTPLLTKPAATKGSIVFTGFRDASLQATLEQRGYQIGSSVTGKTMALVVQTLDSSSSKVKEAQSRHIPIILREKALDHFS